MSRKLGQVFLKNQKIAQKIVKELEIKKGEIIVEIGPGTGFLTQELILSNEKIIAIEKDPKLIGYLKEKFANNKNLILIEGDIREILKEEKVQEIIQSKDYNKGYKIVGNIPYYLTSYLLRLLMNLQNKQNKPKLVVLMVQKEVAERICAKPGDMSVLAISVQLYGQPEIVDIVTKESFFPSPKVDSAILRIVIASETKQSFPLDRHATLAMTKEEEKEFFRCVNIGFSSKRKKLINNLSAGYHLDRKIVSDIMKKSEINEGARAQELKIEDWKALSFEINKEHK